MEYFGGMLAKFGIIKEWDFGRETFKNWSDTDSYSVSLLYRRYRFFTEKIGFETDEINNAKTIHTALKAIRKDLEIKHPDITTLDLRKFNKMPKSGNGGFKKFIDTTFNTRTNMMLEKYLEAIVYKIFTQKLKIREFFKNDDDLENLFKIAPTRNRHRKISGEETLMKIIFGKDSSTIGFKGFNTLVEGISEIPKNGDKVYQFIKSMKLIEDDVDRID